MKSRMINENDVTVKNLGSLLKSKRSEKGLTQAEVAQKVGISTQHYSRLERGEYVPGLQTFLKIAEVLDFDTSEFNIKSNNQISSTMYEIMFLLEKFDITKQKAVLTFLRTLGGQT